MRRTVDSTSTISSTPPATSARARGPLRGLAVASSCPSSHSSCSSLEPGRPQLAPLPERGGVPGCACSRLAIAAASCVSYARAVCSSSSSSARLGLSVLIREREGDGGARGAHGDGPARTKQARRQAAKRSPRRRRAHAHAQGTRSRWEAQGPRTRTRAHTHTQGHKRRERGRAREKTLSRTLSRRGRGLGGGAPPSRGRVDEPNAHVTIGRRRCVRDLAAHQGFLAEHGLLSRWLANWRPAPHRIPRQGTVKRVHIAGTGREGHWEKSALSQVSSHPADLWPTARHFEWKAFFVAVLGRSRSLDLLSFRPKSVLRRRFSSFHRF